MSIGTERYGEDGDLAGTTVAVYGLGKMGLPLAAVLADVGATVRGVDIDESVVSAVNDGRTPVDEPGLDQLVSSFGGEQLVATTDGEAAAAAADVHIVLVPTLVDEAGEPALGPVLDVADDISSGLTVGDLVVLESTAPPGTTAGAFREAVESELLAAGRDFRLAHCPERTSAGRVLRDLTESYPKIVGGIDADSTATAASFYRTFNEPGVIELSSATAAEAVKVFEGVYRDVNIALANELAKACEEWGLDAAEVFEAANSQPYCEIHDPGIGVGGHCIPVYPHFVIGRVEGTPLLETARAVNDGMPSYAVDRLATLLEDFDRPLDQARVLVLGLTYRPGVLELRNSPGFDAITLLNEAGSTTFAHDPLVDDETIQEIGAIPVGAIESVTDIDAVILATGHDRYHDIDFARLRESMRTPVVLDGRNFFDRTQLEGFRYGRIGDGTDR